MEESFGFTLGDRKIVQQLLEQRNLEASWMGWVNKVEPQGIEKRLLLITRDRLFSLRTGGKIAREGHWLELTELASTKPGELLLTFKQFKLHIISDAVDDIIYSIQFAFASTFPGFPEKEKFKVDVQPSSRLKDFEITEQPLGGFITTYKSLCNFYGNEVREDICWDMENLFIPGNINDFNLREFEQPISFNDMRALFGALQYNTYFRTLTAKEFQADKNITQCIADALKSNTKIEELSLVRMGLTKEGIATISEALTVNKLVALTSINISNNNIEDKGMIAFASYIGSMNRGLVKLNVASCGAGKVGMAALCNALKKNVHMNSTLTVFDISQNKLEADGSSALGYWLANPNVLRTLQLSNTNANLEIIIGAIIRGCNELQKLDISNNKFTKKEAPILAKYLAASANLNKLDLSGTGLPVENVKDILTAMGGNLYLKDCEINLADNKFGTPGARVIAALADKLPNVVSLNVSDNDLGDEGLGILAEGLRYNTALKRLAIDRNYKGKTKAKSNGIEGIINLLSSESPLESLSIAGGPKTEWKLDLLPLIYALGTNETLKSLDISGNQMGNKAASALGKALQTNDTLVSLKWDNNGTTYAGFVSFNMGLKRNFSLKVMPIPINGTMQSALSRVDIGASLKDAPSPNSWSDIIAKIESHISRNQSPTAKFQKEGTSEGPASQFGFLSSGQREEVQKLMYKIKGTGRKIPDDKKIVLEDAQNADQIMMNLFSIKDEITVATEHALKQKLVEIVKELSPVYGTMKGQLLQQVATSIKQSFHCFDEEVIRRLQTSLQYGGVKDLTDEDLEHIIVEASGAELNSKASSAFQATVSLAADYLWEKLQDQLRDIANDLLAEILHEEQQKQEEEKLAAQKKNSPREKSGTQSPRDKPVPPPASKKPTKAPPSKVTKGGKQSSSNSQLKEETIHVEELPKAESNLTQRAAVQQKRKPPTRKPRPAPPPGATM